MTTTGRTGRRTAPAAEVPAGETAATEATETPGAAEPDAAAPGSDQEGAPEGERHEPALDEAEPYDFAEHGRRVFAPWPSVGQPRVMTADARKAWRHAEGHIAQASAAALAEVARAHGDAVARVHGRLDDYLLMRTERFPAHAATG